MFPSFRKHSLFHHRIRDHYSRGGTEVVLMFGVGVRHGLYRREPDTGKSAAIILVGIGIHFSLDTLT